MRAPPLYASSSASASSTGASRIARPSRARAPPTPATLRASHAPLDFAAGEVLERDKHGGYAMVGDAVQWR